MLTSIKRVGVTYNEGATTFLPGYMDSTKFLGNNFNSMAPGLDFVFGRQPDSNWLKNAASRGLISSDSIQNNLFRQTYDQRLSINAQLEPARDLIIDINLDKSLNKTYTSLFKDTTGNKNFAELSPYSGGGFSISYIAFQTLFEKFDPNNISATFKKFEDNRIILSRRLGEKNTYSQVVGADGFYKGYGKICTGRADSHLSLLLTQIKIQIQLGCLVLALVAMFDPIHFSVIFQGPTGG